MPVPKKPPQPSHNAIETEVVGTNAVITRMRGHMTRALAESRFEQFRQAMLTTKQPRWIIDQLELTGFDPAAVSAGSRWFESFRAREGELVVFVSRLPAAKMVAASLAFAVHTKIISCETLAKAYEHAGIAGAGVVALRRSTRP